MKPQPSVLSRKRARGSELSERVIATGDPGYEEIYKHAIVDPLFDAISTRLPFTPPEDLQALISGLSEEVRRRVKGS